MVVTRTCFRALLCNTAIALLAASSAWAAFDPQAGAETSSLPDTKVLYVAPTAARAAQASSSAAPLYPSRALAMPSAPAVTSAIATPAPVALTAAPPSLFPPVDPVVAAQAQAQLQREAKPASQAPAPVPVVGFIAPAPLMAAPAAAISAPAVAVAAPEKIAPATVAIAPAAAPAPRIEAARVAPITAPPAPVESAAANELPPVVTAQAAPLTNQSKTILSHIPSKLDAPKRVASTKLSLERVSPEVADILGKDSKDAAYESVGMSIKVSRPGLDTNYELNRAYTSLMGGDTDNAIQTYMNILSTQPTNQDALFGLAATYHRQGNLEKARPLYGALLKLNPNHREGLNNFLALISDESPQEALAELERLEQRNPDFSPIPAQQAIVLDKLGYVQESRAKMLRAIDLAPDNLTYKYNLAVMSDRNGNYADASALYRLLIDASLSGAKTPAPTAELQKRLNFITSVAASEGHALGS